MLKVFIIDIGIVINGIIDVCQVCRNRIIISIISIIVFSSVCIIVWMELWMKIVGLYGVVYCIFFGKWVVSLVILVCIVFDRLMVLVLGDWKILILIVFLLLSWECSV